MRIGVLGRRTGFTLIEILVVLSIVGVISVGVLLATAPSSTAQTRTEARRLATLLELAIAESRATGQSIAWSPAPDGYEFLRKSDDGEWHSFGGDSPYRHRALPAGVLLEAIQFDSQPLREGDRIVITPYGMTGEIRATIVGGSARIVLRGGVIGRVNLETTTAEGPQSGAWLDEVARIHVG